MSRFQNVKKSLAGVGLVAVIALGGATMASAEADGPVTTTVPAGGRACVFTSQRANYQVRADGSAPNAVGSKVQWTMGLSFDHSSYTDIASQTLPGNYYSGQLSAQDHSAYFPTYWRFCARNLSSTTNAKVTLTLTTDANA